MKQMRKLLCMMSILALCFVVGCSDDDDVKQVQMTVSHQTSEMSMGASSQPTKCMLVKESGEEVFKKIPMGYIDGFNYQEGYEYLILAEKTILKNPPQDDLSVRYRLLKILNQTKK